MARVISEIKDFNKQYIKQLRTNFYPHEEQYSYDKVEIDRSTTDRPWIENNEQPEYKEEADLFSQ